MCNIGILLSDDIRERGEQQYRSRLLVHRPAGRHKIIFFLYPVHRALSGGSNLPRSVIAYQAKVFGSREYITHVLVLAVHSTKTG